MHKRKNNIYYRKNYILYLLQAEKFLYFSEEPHFRNEITTMCMLIIFNRNVIWMAIAVTTTRQWDSVMKAASESLLYFVLAHLSANKHDWWSWVDPACWRYCGNSVCIVTIRCKHIYYWTLIYLWLSGWDCRWNNL